MQNLYSNLTIIFCQILSIRPYYFSKLKSVHKYNTEQKQRNEYFQFRIFSEAGRKTLHHICLKVWKNVTTKFLHCQFSTFKKCFKSNMVSNNHTEK